MPTEFNPLDGPLIRQKNLSNKGWTQSAIVPAMTQLADGQTELDTVLEDELVSLLKEVKERDRDSFVVLYDKTVQRVFSLALRITRQQVLAEEVVSDVYLQVWQRADTYPSERGKVIAWLCVLCRSRALDALRRDNTVVRQAAVSIDAISEREDLTEPVDILESMEQGSAIQIALAKLTDQQRQLVALAYFRGYTHSELAEVINIPIGTVKTNLRRTLMKLRELMSCRADVKGESDE